MDSLEYEVRLGVRHGKTFNPSIGQREHDLLVNILKEHTSFVHNLHEYTDTYFTDSLRHNSYTNRTEVKTKIHQNDQIFGKYTIRCCTSKEEPIQKNCTNMVAKHVRQKRRHRFSTERFHIDLTHIQNIGSYELEIEATKRFSRKYSSEFIKNVLISELKNLVASTNL